jgi:hypothetical protein
MTSKHILAGLSTLLLGITISLPAQAVLPTALREGDRGPWSQIINDPFDGYIVYDKDFNSESVFVTTWSPKEIRATLTEKGAIFLGTRRVWRSRNVRHRERSYTEDYYDTEKITQDRISTPVSLMFSIYGKVYTYTKGPVADDLAQALANAPSGDMYIRAVWADETHTTMRIGPQTVAAWKTIFKK